MSFLRKMVTTILKDASASKPEGYQPEASNGSLASPAFPQYGSASCSKWMRFIQAELHQDHAWLWVALIYTQQPYSAPIYFNMDAMIQITESKAMEAEDELCLLQNDLDYFANLMKRHERE